MRIGIVGTRQRNSDSDLELLREVLIPLKASKIEQGEDLSIVSGGCPLGMDRFASILAKELDIPIKIFPADWKKFGKSAGFERNGDIAREADVLIAMLPEDGKSAGTEDTIRKYKKAHPHGQLFLI